MRVLVTGATGFIGSHLCQFAFNHPDFYIVPWSLSKYTEAELANQLKNIDCVVHLASLVHRPEITEYTAYHRSIVEATRKLARLCVATGVKKFIYLSSAAVYGLISSDFRISENFITPFFGESIYDCCLESVYGKAKLEAEKILKEISNKTGLEVVILRAPAVYGKGAKGNIEKAKKLVEKIHVLPFGRANRPRSFINVATVVGFIVKCIQYENLFGCAIFNIDDSINTHFRRIMHVKALYQYLAQGTWCWLVPVPRWLMRLVLTVIGKKKAYQQHFESLQLDCDKAKRFLKLVERFSSAHKNVKFSGTAWQDGYQPRIPENSPEPAPPKYE